MKILKKIVIIVIFSIIINSLFALREKKPAKELIKRTIAIIPFLNKNNVEKYVYLSDTIRNALKTKLLDLDQFQFIAFNDIDTKTIELGYSKESILEESNAKNISLKLKADVFITGFYIIIEDKIMIQIDAYDIFTNKTIASSNVKGEVGLDIFRLVDEITIDMSEKLSKKLPKVDKTYFDEMIKVIKEERKFNFRENFTIHKKIGLGLTIGGSTLLVAGLPILIYDLAAYTDIVTDNLYHNPRSDSGYEDYTKSYYTYIGLLAAGVACLGAGTVLLCVGIPLLTIKFKKKENISFNVEVKNEICFFIKIDISKDNNYF